MLENIIIFLAVFIIIMWLQHNDDLRFKNSKKRLSLYEMIKLPLFVSTLVLLLKNIIYQQCLNELQTIFIVAPTITQPSIIQPSLINQSLTQPSLINQSLTQSTNKDVFNNIFSEQPDF